MSIRNFKSTAFAPLSPSHTRIAGYEYIAFPVDDTELPEPVDNDDEEDDPES